MAKILLIEDDPDYGDTITDALRAQGHAVELVENGMDGLGKLRAGSFDLIISDWGLPDISGISLCRQFREAGGATPLLMLTGRGDINDKEVGFDAGVDDYLTKPCSHRELMMRVKALLRRGAETPQGLPPTRGDSFSIGNLSPSLAEKYEVLGVIGVGSTGTVYKASHRLLEKPVAIKVMHPHLVADPRSSVRFWQEAKALSKLSHPLLVSVYDFGLSTGGQLYMIVDYLEGASLQAVLRQEGHLSLPRALRLFLPLCDAIGYLHNEGQVHRDIKPENIMIVRNDAGNETPYIVDFGLIKSLLASDKDRQALTQFGEIVGSPMYMSPEQYTGLAMDCRSDIFSFGCVMYEVLTGVVPLVGENALETMQLRIDATVKRFSEVKPDLQIEGEIEKVVLKTLARHPADRYQSMADVRRDLERCCEAR
jgi:serine/threonine protein kinase